MRILAVTNLYPTAETPALGTWVEQQIKGLRSAGLDVDVLYINRLATGPGTYLTVRRRVRERIQEFDPDVVHVMYGGVMADIVTRAVKDRPTVVTFHGSDLLGEHVSGWWRRVMAHIGVMCSHRAARVATGIVVVAQLLFDALPTGIDRAKVRIIPCGIDRALFTPLDRSVCRRELGWAEDGFHVLFNSNGDDPVKQPGLARSAVEVLARSGIRAEFQELRKLPYAEMPRRLNAGDVLLLTSRHEGSPTIVKEALSCNVPIVSVDVGDVRQQLDGIAGCYLAAPDPIDLAAKLRWVYDGPRRVDGRGKMEALESDRVGNRLKHFYLELCSAIRPVPDPRGTGIPAGSSSTVETKA
jgi:glycosyltransferase involved in cell wall biosynthesis